MNQDLKEFISNHRINVLDTNKRAHRFYKVDMRYFEDPTDFNVVKQSTDYVTEPLYTIEVAESELQRIADFESRVFNNMRKQGHYNMFETIMKQKEQEKFLRTKYTSVQKAYEHYSLMLKLAESGEL